MTDTGKFHIVVATDGSEGAFTAARWTASYLVHPNVKVTILTVTRMTVDDALHNRYEQAATASQKVLSQTETLFSGSKVDTASVNVVGVPATAVPQYAHDQGADLIVLGHVGHSALGGMGSIAFSVLHHAECPVLLVPSVAAPSSSELNRPLRVILSTDGSDESNHAASWLNAWLAGTKASISVLSVTRESTDYYHDPSVDAPSLANSTMQGIAAPAWGFPGVYWLPSTASAISWADTADRARAHADEAREKAVSLLPDCPPEDQETGFGSPAESILDHIDTYHADLIVMGRREHSALGNLLSSVSYTVIQRSPVPVLLVGRHFEPPATQKG